MSQEKLRGLLRLTPGRDIWIESDDKETLLLASSADSILGVGEELRENLYLRYPLPPAFGALRDQATALTPVFAEYKNSRSITYWARLTHPYLESLPDDAEDAKELAEVLERAGPVLIQFGRHDTLKWYREQSRYAGFRFTTYDLAAKLPRIKPFYTEHYPGHWDFNRRYERDHQLVKVSYSTQARVRREHPVPRMVAAELTPLNGDIVDALIELLRRNDPHRESHYARFSLSGYTVSRRVSRLWEALRLYEFHSGVWSYRGLESYAKWLKEVAEHRIGTLRKFAALDRQFAAWMDRELRSPLGKMILKGIKLKTEEERSAMSKKVQQWQRRYEDKAPESSLASLRSSDWRPPELPKPKRLKKKARKKKGRKRGKNHPTELVAAG